MFHPLIAVTADGCSIRRDDPLGYVVECGQQRTQPLHAATLAAAYALCQQLVPRGSMATCDLPSPGVENASAAALHQLKEMLQADSAFAQALRATESTEAAARLAAEHGVSVTPEALWRHRGTLVSGGLLTWRG